MALPPGLAPTVAHPRRYLWLAQRDRARSGDDGPATAFEVRRLATPGTALPATFPHRATLLAAGLRAVEEVVGAGVGELRAYGLATPQAERLVLWLERYTVTTFSTGPRVGQFYEADDVTLLASAARTTSVTSDAYEVGDRGTARLTLAITAASGTAPRLHVQIETCDTAGGTYRVVDAFPIQSATATVTRSMSGLDRFVRAVCTISGGTPSFTFSLTGEAV